MAAKKTSGKKSNNAGAPAVNKNWEAGLVRAQFEEDSWQACVTFVVGSSPQDEELIKALSLAVEKPERKLFSVISWDRTIEKIHELGNPKAKKTDNVPMFHEVTEQAKVLLDAGDEIPCDLMAKILKFQLLHIKAIDQNRRDAEQTEGKEEKTTPSSNSKSKSGSDKKGKDVASAPGDSKEKKTKLRRRGDAEPPTFIDDEPECGPHHYILLLGFYQPYLICLLNAITVHVANVIKLCSEHTQTGQQLEQHRHGVTDLGLKESPVQDADVALLARKLDLFWSGLRPVLESGPSDSRLHDVVQLSYTVPDFAPPFDTQDPEAVLQLGSQIFDGVSNLIYECLDWRRQHQHYCDNVKFLRVPSVGGLDSQSAEVVQTVTSKIPRSQKKSVQEQESVDKETKLLPLSTDVDMCYYSSLLDLVPPEACSVPLMLHCMLEQVVISTEQSFPTPSCMAEDSQAATGPRLDSELVSCMLKSFLPFIHTEEEKRFMLDNLLATVEKEEDRKRLFRTFGGVEKKSEQPVIIRHHDEIALRLRDISVTNSFSVAEVESSMMKFSPAWQLIQSVTEQIKSTSCWKLVKQQLQYYCTDDAVSWPDVERLFQQSVFEAMTLRTMDQQGVLPNTTGLLATQEQEEPQRPTFIPWDDPLSYAKQQLHNLMNKGPTFVTEDPANMEQLSRKVCCQLDLSEMQKCRLRSLFDWHYSEHHDAAVFPQVLQSAFEEYRCLDTFTGSSNNILYVFCHNPMNCHRQSKEFWDVKLHTDVKFRKYLEHVADSMSNWIVDEELKRETMEDNQRPTEDDKAVPSEEANTPLEPVIRKDSLKAWKLEQEQMKEEEINKKSKKENTTKGKQQKEEDPSKDSKKSKALSGDKKSRPNTASSSAKAAPESAVPTAPPGNKAKGVQLAEEPSCCFTGYSMDGQLVHVSGRVQCLFPSDGGQITVENVSFVEGSSLMKLCVKKDGHNFYTHINHIFVDPVKEPCVPQDKKNTDPTEAGGGSEHMQVKRVKQGSLSAVLDNKIHLSYSFYGPTGECSDYSFGKEEGSIQEPIPLSSSNHSTDLESVPSLRQTQSNQDCEGTKPFQFNNLNVYVPNGLLLQFLQEDTPGVSPVEKNILVRQSFPLQGRGQMQHLQDVSLSKELSRLITSQGAVIRHFRDGSTEVLFADGSVSFSQDSGPVWVPDSDIQGSNTQQESDKDQTSENETETQKGCWQTTSPSGDRICTIGTEHKHIPISSLLSFKATDPITNQVMVSREDLVVSVENPDGSFIVDHADGTRITSLLQNRPLNATQHHLLHTGEKPENFTHKSSSQFSRSHSCVRKDGNPHIHGACESGDEISCKSVGNFGHCCEDGGTNSNVHERDEQTDFPEESVTEREKLSTPTKERVVLVEKEGCATVVMYPERHSAHILLADGSIITGNNRGEYEVFPSSAGFLQIQNDGKCVYSSYPLVASSAKHGATKKQTGIYTMSHIDKVACDIMDADGNHFQVMEDGQISVLSMNPAPRTPKNDIEEEEREMETVSAKNKDHCPRLFLVDEYGSGTELLSSHTVEELLHQAYSDPTIALLTESLPDKQDEFGITILKPSPQNVWFQWMLEKQNPNITPPNLRNRSWHDFPPVEKIMPGPAFGTNVGVGLTLTERCGGSEAKHQLVRSCPKVLEIRELCQHQPFTTAIKNTVDIRLKEYIESLMEREQLSEEMKVKDPRSEEEVDHAKNLFTLILSFADEDDISQSSDTRISVDVASLYSQGVGASAVQSDVTEDTNTQASDGLERAQCFSNRNDLKWTERLVKYRQEISDERTQREALRNKTVVPYFHQENIPLYANLLHHQTPDMGNLSMDISLIPKSDCPQATDEKESQQSTPRPLNPTPSKSESHAAVSDRLAEQRPTNPTPQTAGESSLIGSSRKCKPTQVDVTGKPRRTAVRLPACILSSKPCSVPNQHFLKVEEPVRRKCRTISLSDAGTILRGFQLHPSSVDFGIQQMGTSATISVVMRNVGVDTCRFHVKQPPPATGLRVIYNPGPVAAGLSVELKVQLFAICGAQAETEQKKHVSQDIIIHTETDILYLPVTATILSVGLFDKEQSRTQEKRGSKAFQP
ncbi:sperm-associated antigen 17 [Menidia menidia]